jgi:hypothetical protein
MKKSLLKLSAVVLAGLLSVNTNPAQAQRGGPTRFNGFAAAVFMTVNGNGQTFNVDGSGANLIAPGGASFNNGFGTFAQNSALLWFMGGELKTYKESGANVCGASIAYDIHPYCGNCYFIPSAEYPLNFKADCDNGVFADGYGPCSFGDQKWARDNNGIDLTNRPPGEYAMDIFFKINGSDNNPSACDRTNTWIATETGGGYYATAYKARFTIVAPTAARPAVENVAGLIATTNDAVASLSVYPSPATSIVSIDLLNFNEGAVQMEIANIQGSTVKKVTATYIKGQSISLDMSSYTAGMYFVRLSQGSKTAVAKVVKR